MQEVRRQIGVKLAAHTIILVQFLRRLKLKRVASSAPMEFENGGGPVTLRMHLQFKCLSGEIAGGRSDLES